MQGFFLSESSCIKLHKVIYNNDKRGLIFTTTWTTETTFVGDKLVAIGSSAAIKKVVQVVIVVVNKMLVVFLRISGFFCIFVPQKNIFIYLWNHVIIKFKVHSSKLKVSVVPSSQHITFRTSNRCQPGWNYADFSPQTPIWRPCRNWNAARFFRRK